MIYLRVSFTLSLWDQSLLGTQVWCGIWEGTHFKVAFFPFQEVSLTYLSRRSSLIKVGYRGHSNRRSPPEPQHQEGCRHLAVPHSTDSSSRPGSLTPPSCESCAGCWKEGGPIHVMLPPTNRESHREEERPTPGPDRHASPTINHS